MKAAFVDSPPFAQSGLPFAVLLCKTPHGNLHMGVIVDGDDGSTTTYDLGWDDYFRTNKWESPFLWVAPDVDDETLEQVRSYVVLVAEKYNSTGRMPYGLRFNGTRFDQSNGSMILAQQGVGLTCATFVLALFETAYVSLVDEASWPVRTADDRAWLKQVEAIADADLFARLTREVDNEAKRIRPEEVVAACTATALPASFSTVNPLVPLVLATIAKHYP